MDAFINLSINDRNDEQNEFIDINNMASLSINDSNNNNNNDYNPYNNMIYDSTNMHFRDPRPVIYDMENDTNIVSDCSDIDMLSGSNTIPSISEKIQSNEYETEPSEVVRNKKVETVDNPEADVKLVNTEMIEPEGEDNENMVNIDKEETATPEEPSMLHNILSPTQLGIHAARRSSVSSASEIPCISSNNNYNNYNNNNNNLQTWRDRPIHVSINNNNNFYYQDPNTLNQQQYMIENDKYIPDHDTLPRPWSPKSSPVSRIAYNFYSYLQLTLNSLTGTIIIWFIVSAIKKDIYSLWYSDQRQLFLESQSCQEDWLINDCEHNMNLPALTDRCNEWHICMTRDNNKLFGTRSIRIVTLLGQLINGFIQPIGWKPVTVILIGIITWLFLTNFLMGFLRAKYYYNEKVSPQKPTRLPEKNDGNGSEQESNTNKTIHDVVDSNVEPNQQLQLTLTPDK
ncbi:hypothetical protein C6P45_003800 [Maudiozyma exigua]|uniref:Brl1/Brr6 domain-containing protein n=1 Tax=Maudiozyma exigua TaxID=34358 RepID=A0A9P6WC09_MAUEX|nr:hypothetical protein C6P45_003800 [Kazachstania exigua]